MNSFSHIIKLYYKNLLTTRKVGSFCAQLFRSLRAGIVRFNYKYFHPLIVSANSPQFHPSFLNQIKYKPVSSHEGSIDILGPAFLNYCKTEKSDSNVLSNPTNIDICQINKKCKLNYYSNFAH